MKMKSTTLLLVLAAICTTAATAAEPRCPLIPMEAITGKPDEQANRCCRTQARTHRPRIAELCQKLNDVRG